jgi:hypothetical protein
MNWGIHVCMMAKVQVILVLVLAFTYIYNANKTHNMLTLMLELRFKSLDVVKTFVRHEIMI